MGGGGKEKQNETLPVEGKQTQHDLVWTLFGVLEKLSDYSAHRELERCSDFFCFHGDYYYVLDDPRRKKIHYLIIYVPSKGGAKIRVIRAERPTLARWVVNACGRRRVMMTRPVRQVKMNTINQMTSFTSSNHWMKNQIGKGNQLILVLRQIALLQQVDTNLNLSHSLLQPTRVRTSSPHSPLEASGALIRSTIRKMDESGREESLLEV
jgi:hypothetical protein